MATKEQVKRIYALGAAAGLLDGGRGNDDDLHLWVRQWSPKCEHISALPERQAEYIIAQLKAYCGAVNAQKPLPIAKNSGGVSQAQQTLIFRMTYKLAALSPSDVPVRDRLCGIIHAAVGVDADPSKDIFAGLSQEQGADIIETIKRYIKTEERKLRRQKMKGEPNGNVGTGGNSPPE